MTNLNISNLSNMATDELLKLKAAIEEELQRRSYQQVDELVVYQHDCHGSAGYHLNKYKHWSKLIKAIDQSKTNGFAFVGDFLPVDRQAKVRAGSVVVEACGDKICAYRITKEGKKLIAEGRTKEMVILIDKVAAALQ